MGCPSCPFCPSCPPVVPVPPTVPDVQTVRKFEGIHFYPGCGGGFYQAKIDCDYDKDLCMYEEFRVGKIYAPEELGLQDVSGDSFISIGDPDITHYIKQSDVEDPKLICSFYGTFSASESGKGKTNELKPMALTVSDACNDASKAKEFVVKAASFFDRVYFEFSQDGGETYYTTDQPRMTASIALGGEGRRNLGFWSIVSGAINVVSDICDATGIFYDSENDPNNPLNPDGTPLVYANPRNPASIPSGWEGGFGQSNSDFAYPIPDLSSIEVTTNM